MRNLLALIIFSLLAFNFCLNAKAENSFSAALRTCSSYSKQGVIPYNGENFNLAISLEKTIKGQCVYREKIFQPIGYQELTCTFNKTHLPYLADSMEKYNQVFKKEIAKNDIFEAKMSTNGQIFQKFLANPQICQISYKKN